MGREHTMARSTRTGLGAAALLAAGIAIAPAVAQEEDRPFRTMTAEPEVSDDPVYQGVGPYGHKTLCVIPEPPAELTPTNGHEFAYMFWLEKLEMERRLETGECDCQVDEITWEEVGEQALPWLANESKMFPEKRTEIIEELNALQAAVLTECTG